MKTAIRNQSGIVFLLFVLILVFLFASLSFFPASIHSGIFNDNVSQHAKGAGSVSDLNYEVADIDLLGYGLFNLSLSEPLRVPEMTNDTPGPGKRVRVTPFEYEGTDVHHALYLPVDWEAGKKYPVVVEYTGNYAPSLGSTGEVKDASLGYGLSAGAFIWVVMPYVSEDGQMNEVRWWGDEQATVGYCLANVGRICAEYGGDPSKVFICGFSRGAIAVNYIGLYNDEIARLWRGFISHDHYDGVKEWNTYWGAPLEAYRAKAKERLERMQGRPALVMQRNSTKGTKTYLGEMTRFGDFTFLDVQIDKIIPVIPHGEILSPHTDRWLLFDSEWTHFAREWINKVIKGNE